MFFSFDEFLVGILSLSLITCIRQDRENGNRTCKCHTSHQTHLASTYTLPLDHTANSQSLEKERKHEKTGFDRLS